MGADLQTSEVEAVVVGMPGHVLDKLHLCCRTTLWWRRAAGEAGCSLLDAQEGV